MMDHLTIQLVLSNENRNDNVYLAQTAGSQFMTSFGVHPYSLICSKHLLVMIGVQRLELVSIKQC